MTAHVPQGSPGIEQMCRLAGVSMAGYRHWRQSAPRQEETGLRDVIQRLALANRHYGYRRIGALLGREGWQVNHKRVLRVMGEDNLLCLRTRPFVPRTTDSRHSWRVVPNLARGMELTGVNQGRRHHVFAPCRAVRLSGGCARCIQSQGHRMGARTPLAGQPCCRCPKNGDLRTCSGSRQFDPSFRQGRSIRLHHLF
ncbi:MAG: transposase [Mesorhizobium sp.]|nr:MAG: transposase [Mesorhizobium sp.]TIP80978.1 MAG: transposase [Mesorhizobium sp.]